MFNKIGDRQNINFRMRSKNKIKFKITLKFREIRLCKIKMTFKL